MPAYTSANTSKNGVANYNDGTYVLMPIRIHCTKVVTGYTAHIEGNVAARFHPLPEHRVYLATLLQSKFIYAPECMGRRSSAGRAAHS